MAGLLTRVGFPGPFLDGNPMGNKDFRPRVLRTTAASAMAPDQGGNEVSGVRIDQLINGFMADERPLGLPRQASGDEFGRPAPVQKTLEGLAKSGVWQPRPLMALLEPLPGGFIGAVGTITGGADIAPDFPGEGAGGPAQEPG